MSHPPAPASRPRRPLELWCDTFPSVSETFVLAEARALAGLGHPVRIGAGAPGDGPGDHGLPVSHLWREGTGERLRAMAAVAARHPWRCLQDLAARRRWRREEPVPPLRTLAPAIRRLEASGALVHAHFATGPALRALRASRVLGRPWSLTAHAYDIYLAPANLPEKLSAAALVTSGCEYTVQELRRRAGPGDAGRVHEIVMGVDPERFRRTAPAPGGRRILAVGRLVEKKGFALLLDALADPRLARADLVLVGAGPLLDALRAQAAALGVERRVRFTGALAEDAVRGELEAADVLAMPCVVAADGDRDSMPVVVKEAMAMEVPVVVSDAVGLPEVVVPGTGVVVATGDASALAAGLAQVLALGPAERAALGRAGRARVIERADLRTETARLSALLAELPETARGHASARPTD
ncbi:glycosyltransferase [Paraconexibacter antarcticus]|uniref:Glycosyltransferase n=1 Tax=Paraconexibacter antarcticus TaxID=2949664 RepID=A0ABY5DNP8_9ACTN|nr:glycosyltransferase [Paraconexibacter antarcticus]UTI62677.1 glycosyltransferase [Paraconexibacter antarcticus]